MRIILPHTQEYPPDCLRLVDPPKKLYVRGTAELLQSRPTLGIVGSRKMTDYGKRVLDAAVPEFVARGITIVSGLAFGVDAHAHKLTLESGGKTLAVLGSGIEHITPYAHRALGQQIEKTGAIVSEYPRKTPATRYSFPARNRIIAALSDVLLVIEGTRSSGSLITADFMQQLGKDIFALPGQITAPLSRAPNFLIAHGAHPFLGAEDVLTYFGFDKPRALHVLSDVSAEERIILDLLDEEPHTADQLCEHTQLPPQQINTLLTTLEINRRITKTDNGTFTRI